jgi:hypothetical protein
MRPEFVNADSLYFKTDMKVMGSDVAVIGAILVPIGEFSSDIRHMFHTEVY